MAASSPGWAMVRALDLARAAKGRTSPNPAVGAVIARDGVVVGEGATQPGGRPHAETESLHAAGEAARGATMYVTLEPCAHYGRTPPCANAVVEAGVAEVHLATLDPNPLVAGKGRAILERAGIRTFTGEGQVEARALNEDFAKWITTGRPLVIAKLAVSLDGRVATRTGESQWITGPEARAEGHRVRDHVDAILVGVNTVLADNPQLTTRLESTQHGWEPHHPLRFVLDSQARTPPTARILDKTLPANTTIFTTEAAPADRRAALEAAGAELVVVPSESGRVSLPAVLAALGERRVTSVLVEGGATVHGAFFDGDLVDQVMAFIAPLVIGGVGAPGAVGGRGAGPLAEARRLHDVEVRRVGADTLVSGWIRRVEWPEN
jgi:diaminohydroxyphosphoribosylaminopyrimidine deaminase/5-amino-6-(5-phosphoribosylamino)uracil reductase